MARAFGGGCGRASGERRKRAERHGQRLCVCSECARVCPRGSHAPIMLVPIGPAACEFFYDFSSPYSYLAAVRVDEVLPMRPVWRPIAFGVIVQRVGKVPWSFAEDRHAHFEEIDRRAIGLG